MSARQMHIGCAPGDVGGFCLLPGDPGRSEAIASHFDCPRKVAQSREFVTYTGSLLGETVSVCSTGIGGPSAAIALEELVKIGAHTFIRVGTCGGIAKQVRGGNLVVALSAVRQEGTSREYMPLAYPATADYEVVLALAGAAKARGYAHHVGVVQSKDSFYGQHEKERMPIGLELSMLWSAYQKAGVLASEMETAALYVVSATLGVRTASILYALWNQEAEGEVLGQEEARHPTAAIETAIDAMKTLIRQKKGGV